jgi:hypothetical protein
VQVKRIRDVVLPDDGLGDVPVTADLVYAPRSRNSKKQPMPLIIVAPGAASNKDFYRCYSGMVARRGYAVLVVQQLRSIPSFAPFLLVPFLSDRTANVAVSALKNASQHGTHLTRINIKSLFLDLNFIKIKQIAGVYNSDY